MTSNVTGCIESLSSVCSLRLADTRSLGPGCSCGCARPIHSGRKRSRSILRATESGLAAVESAGCGRFRFDHLWLSRHKSSSRIRDRNLHEPVGRASPPAAPPSLARVPRRPETPAPLSDLFLPTAPRSRQSLFTFPALPANWRIRARTVPSTRNGEPAAKPFQMEILYPEIPKPICGRLCKGWRPQPNWLGSVLCGADASRGGRAGRKPRWTHQAGIRLPENHPSPPAGRSHEPVRPSPLFGSNGMRLGPDGWLYVTQVFGSQITAINPATGEKRGLSARAAERSSVPTISRSTPGA